MSSGSLAYASGPCALGFGYPGVEYPASKAAVNMITVQYAKAFPGMRVNAVDPGFTATDVNGRIGTQTVGQGAAVIVRMAQVSADSPAGGYVDARGPHPLVITCRTFA